MLPEFKLDRKYYSTYPGTHSITKIPLKDFPSAFRLLKTYQQDLSQAMILIWPEWTGEGRQAEEEQLDNYPPIESDVDPSRLWRARRRVRELQDQLWVSNINLVQWYSQRFYSPGLDTTDLIQIGLLGLSRAIERYDVDLGNTFSTYALHWIHQHIMRCIQNTDRLVRIPVHLRMHAARIWSGGISATETSGLKLAIRQLNQEMLSIEDATDDPAFVEATTTYPDMVDQDLMHLLFHSDVGRRVLTKRDRFILRRRFGLLDGREWTLEDIGIELGLTRERIRQLQVKALGKARHVFRINRIDGL